MCRYCNSNRAGKKKKYNTGTPIVVFIIDNKQFPETRVPTLQ